MAAHIPHHADWHALDNLFYLQELRVVDVLDAFEAKRKRAAKPIFEAVQWAIGGGWYVRATLADGTVDRIEGFASEGDAGR